MPSIGSVAPPIQPVETWREIDAYLRNKHIRIGAPTTVQTTGGKHAAGSFHYSGTARDYGLYDSDAAAVAKALKPVAAMPNTPIAELFFAPLNIWYKNGRSISGSAIGGHRDHCHVALKIDRHLRSPAFTEKQSSDTLGTLIGAVASANPTIGLGSAGRDVKALQAQLTKLGYALTPDGMFGPKTQAAVRAFQAKKGLATDGVVGPKTWAALDEASLGVDAAQFPPGLGSMGRFGI